MSAGTDADWSVPESWLVEADHQRRVAAAYRAESEMYAREHRLRQIAGAPAAELHALELSKMHLKLKAAEIERAMHLGSAA